MRQGPGVADIGNHKATTVVVVVAGSGGGGSSDGGGGGGCGVGGGGGGGDVLCVSEYVHVIGGPETVCVHVCYC